MQRWLVLLTLLVLPIVAYAQTDEWKQLFDGKDLTGWKHVGPGSMTVEDGLIRTHGGMGLLYWTGGKLGNCVIRVVFKMHDHNDNSGVYIRTPIEPREPWMPVHILKPAMAVVISMLRGVNLGSHNRIKMDALRARYESLKLRDPQTYIQSGNVIFRTEERNLAQLAKRIENGNEQKFGFRPQVILRTTSERRDVIARNPFAKRRGIDPSKLLVTFLAEDPGAEARDKVCSIKADPEELRIESRELYIYFPNGIGRAKLSLAAIERALKTPGTGRNWNSVTKMLEMAEKLEASK